MNNLFSKINQRKVWLAILLLVITFPSRMIHIDRAINIDEPFWVISSSNFYYAITHKNFEDTYFEYHPGVTNMWIISTALFFYFPEYRAYEQGFFDTRKPKYEEFMRSHGKEAIELVRISRYIQAGILTFLVIAAFLLLSILIGENAALLATALAIISPFFLGHSRLLNMEGMVALFVLVSLLGMQVYINKERKTKYLLLSGLAFGLAQLTKSTSIVLIGVVTLILFIDLFKRIEQDFSVKLWNTIRTFLIWLGAAVLIYFLLWPGMWVAPGRMLSEVYGNAFSYAFQGARLEVTEQLQPASFSLTTRFDGIFQYLQNWTTSTTPITWLGLIFSIFAVFSKDKQRSQSPMRSTLVYLAILGGLFIAMFGIAQGRNSQHYILSSYVCFDVMAGIGWGYAWTWMQSRWTVINRVYISILFFIVLIGTQISLGLPYAPYYFNYKSPFASEAATLGYGEGLSQAADYLAQKPNAKDIRAYVYNGMGTFSFFFPGETLVFKRVYLITSDYSTITNEMRESDYLVLYPIIRKQQPETEKIFRAFQDISPEKTIIINGLDYIYIYRTIDIPEAVYEKILQ
ncbi:glycosyltransferase family 39 protein [Candidatus Villigracilis saccharophilus]|uniref:ArnT family glycosyltransferase n=1 Tax=Candidatus Villigracilis saccharophilus TaxID=3140684 RepID=UPI0031350421|nr:glycosyltransferase family 39 protein [Anaerolineales bacterium]